MDPTSFTPHSLCLAAGDDVVLHDDDGQENNCKWSQTGKRASTTLGYTSGLLEKARLRHEAMPYTNVSHDTSPAEILATALRTLSTNAAHNHKDLLCDFTHSKLLLSCVLAIRKADPVVKPMMTSCEMS